MAGAAYLWSTRFKPQLHLATIAVLPCWVLSIAMGENLLPCERTLGCRLSDRLELNPIADERVEALAPYRNDTFESSETIPRSIAKSWQQAPIIIPTGARSSMQQSTLMDS